MNKKKLLLVGGLAVGAALLMFASGGEAHAAVPEPDDDDADDDASDMPPPITGEVPDGQDAHELEDVAEEIGDVLEGLPEVKIPPPVVKPAPVQTPKLPPPQVIVDEVIKNLPIERGPAPKVPKVPKVEAPSVDMPIILPDPGEVVTAPEPSPLAPATLAMVRALLAKERDPKWKSLQEPLVAAWQRSRGLPDDGKYGPGSALHLAEETGLLPIVRAWPKGTWPEKAVPDFRAKLLALANVAESPRREHLMAAAEREQGQAFGTPPKPVVVHITGV